VRSGWLEGGLTIPPFKEKRAGLLRDALNAATAEQRERLAVSATSSR